VPPTAVLPIVRISGDGVGPELVAGASRVVEALGLPVRWIDAPAGMGAFAAHGATAPESTIAELREHRLAIKGPFHTPSGGTIRSGNHYIRRALDLYACLRPLPIVAGRAPVLLVRENLEDLYGAIEWMATPDVAQAVKVASRRGCERITRYAFETARAEHRAKVTLVHKANNLKLTEGLFLSVARSVASEYPGVEFEDMLADTAAAALVLDPAHFDIVLTSHTIGDILSNLGAALAGSLGLVGSLDSGEDVHVAEASHGSADELAGRDRVNPLAILQGVVLLLGAIGRIAEQQLLADALCQWESAGPRTFDLGGGARTSEVIDHICDLVQQGAR
jgi:isocitrate dehydrogenase (NAD+)